MSTPCYDAAVRSAPVLLLVATMTTSFMGCRRVSDRTLRDTEGRSFGARCDREGQCELSETSGSGRALPRIVTLGRLMAFCPPVAGEAEAPPAGECRALVCESDADCPPGHGLRDGTCVNGLCIDPAGQLDSDDSVALCLAGTGLGRSSAVQVERYALGLNCGHPCKVPSTCRQP
jgi:hypothetical protein